MLSKKGDHKKKIIIKYKIAVYNFFLQHTTSNDDEVFVLYINKRQRILDLQE